MSNLKAYLAARGYEIEERNGYLVATRRDDDAIDRIYLDPSGEVRLERRRVTAEEGRPLQLGRVNGEYLRREEVTEVFLARNVADPKALIAAWEVLEELL